MKSGFLLKIRKFPHISLIFAGNFNRGVRGGWETNWLFLRNAEKEGVSVLCGTIHRKGAEYRV
jgi:hypothetical protein